MGQRVDIPNGTVFGLLTVIKEAEPRYFPSSTQGHRQFECECQCGARTQVLLSSLRAGNTTSCGCHMGKSHRQIVVEPGEVFNRLTVIKEIESRRVSGAMMRRVQCRCACGRIVNLYLGGLRAGQTKSCGCLRSDILRAKPSRRTHGERRTKLYKLWCDIKQRCFNPKHPAYERYGARGITVYGPWVHDYQAFAAWMNSNLGPRPDGLTLDRANNDGSYEPGNLRWANRSTQCRNQERWNDPEKRRSALNRANEVKRQQRIPSPQLALI